MSKQAIKIIDKYSNQYVRIKQHYFYVKRIKYSGKLQRPFYCFLDGYNYVNNLVKWEEVYNKKFPLFELDEIKIIPKKEAMFLFL